MSKRTVVIVGSSPFATSLASLLSQEALEVHLVLDQEPHGAPPWGLGATRADGAQRATLSLAWGALRELEDRRALRLGGALMGLPLGRMDLVRALPDRGEALGGLARVRARRRMGTVLALGKEIRSYRDWVVGHMGVGLYEQLYRPWAHKRFATEPERLSAALADREHGVGPRGPWVAPTRPWSEVVRAQLEGIGAVRHGLEGVEPSEEGPVVLSEGRRIHCDLALFQRSPVVASGWLGGELEPRERWDLKRLGAAHAVQVTLPARCEHLPWVTHVIDADKPFWRLSRPGLLPGGERWQGHLTAHLSLADTDPLWSSEDGAMADAVRQALLGLADPIRGEALVQRRPHAVPWSGQTSSVALGRRLEVLDQAGIVLMGPEGAHQLLDPAQALQHALALVDATSQRQVHRDLLERRVRLSAQASPRLFNSA